MWLDNYPQPHSLRSKTPRSKRSSLSRRRSGLRSVTDGELRRAYWHFDFLAGLDGVEMVEAQGIKFAGVTAKAEAPYVKGKLGSHHHPQIAHFEFLKANTKRTAKMMIPALRCCIIAAAEK